MNILYLADPNDNHDLKWISFFRGEKSGKTFLMPRTIHRIPANFELENPGLKLATPIPNFSTFRFYETLMTAVTIRRFIRDNEIDLIHVLFAEPNALWCLFRGYFGIPIVVTCRGTDVLKTIPATFRNKSIINFFVSSAYRKAFNRADFVTGTSQRQLDSILNFSGRTVKMQVVRTGVDVAKLQTDTSSFFPSNITGPYILFPRYIRPIYNHEFCITAIGLLPPDAKAKYKMVFVGKDRDAQEAAYQDLLTERMKATEGVDFIFLPEVSQETMFELYKRAELVVMTPLSDGSPVSAMDAIACGAKVILGPLPYDDFFKSWTYQLKSWSAAELSELIVHCLSDKNKNDVQAYIPLADKNEEMKKVAKIYEQVLRQNEINN